MPIDANIALGIRPVEPVNMLGQMGQMMQMRQAQQEYDKQNNLRDAFSQGTDLNDPATFDRIARQDPTLAYNLRSKHLDQQQKQTEVGLKRADFLGAAYGGLVKNPTVENAYSIFDNAVAMGIIPSQAADGLRAKIAATGGDPKQIAALAQQGVDGAISAKEKMSDATSRANNAASVGASYYGSNTSRDNSIRSDTRAREQDQYNRDNPAMQPLAGEKVVNGEKVPAYFGYDPRSNTMVEVSMPTVSVGAPTTIDTPTNALAPANVNALTMPPAGAPTSPVMRPATAAMPSVAAPSAAMPSAAAPTSVVPGAVRFGPKSTSENLTESQGKSTGFALRAKQASDILDIVGKDGKVQPGLIKRAAEAIPLMGEGLGTALNATQSPQQQQVEQAQRSFVNAILRQESGAAINESEFINAKKQYFPQPGDSKEVIDQKRLNRETAVRALSIAGGPGMKQADTGSVKVGTVDEGYKFKGGDPANKNNWVKQ